MKELIRFRQFLAEGLVNENQMKNLAKLLRDEADQPDNKVGKNIFLKYAAQAEKTDVKDIKSLLQKLEDELIDKHPDTFSGEDDIVGSFLSTSKNYTAEGYINENVEKIFKDTYDGYADGFSDDPGEVNTHVWDEKEDFEDDTVDEFKAMQAYLKKNKQFVDTFELEEVGDFKVVFTLAPNGEDIKMTFGPDSKL